MVHINEHFLKLSENYLFADIAKKVSEYAVAHPEADIIRLGIGDVTRPISKPVIQALHAAVDEMGNAATFQGYGPYEGYNFLRNKIVAHDFKARGIKMEADEIFVSDGAKSDVGNITDILGGQNRVAVSDPVYPAYIDTNVMSGCTGEFIDGQWSDIVYLPCTAENKFTPALPSIRPDVIYLCSPNNPTGTALNKTEIKKWVDYALTNNSLILFDAAYEAYIHEDDVPHSIFEIEGAKRVAIEFRSFSKTAGFTGLRCGYAIIPKELTVKTSNGQTASLNQLWIRRQATKFNGTAYIIQKAAEAVFSDEGQRETQATINYYMENARTIRKGLLQAGYKVFGGVNAPYIWLEVPEKGSSWDFFDKLLNGCQVVGTPGVGFGPHGEGYFRLTAFGDQQRTIEAIERIKKFA
ncbi:LL-diaminopimelate aminotransferase [Bacteroidia bacterium]|nr:LL-diaminopimelate aminotransferase [Bacteroidia bacterium]